MTLPVGRARGITHASLDRLKLLAAWSMLVDHAVLAFAGLYASGWSRAPGRFAMAAFALIFVLRLAGRASWLRSALWCGAFSVPTAWAFSALYGLPWLPALLNPLSALALTALACGLALRALECDLPPLRVICAALVCALALSCEYGPAVLPPVLLSALLWSRAGPSARLALALACPVSVALWGVLRVPTLAGLSGALVALLPAAWLLLRSGRGDPAARLVFTAGAGSSWRRVLWLAFFPLHLSALALSVSFIDSALP